MGNIAVAHCDKYDRHNCAEEHCSCKYLIEGKVEFHVFPLWLLERGDLEEDRQTAATTMARNVPLLADEISPNILCTVFQVNWGLSFASCRKPPKEWAYWPACTKDSLLPERRRDST